MKSFLYIASIVVALSSINANAWNNRRGGPAFVNGPRFNGPYVAPYVNNHRWHNHRPGFRPVYPVNPGYPVYPVPAPLPAPVPVYPNPIPDPIEEQAYGWPTGVYVNEPCDPYQYAPPVVNTIPAQSVYCTGAYVNNCQQNYPGLNVIPYNIPAAGICEIRPAFRPGTFVLLLNRQTVLASGSAGLVNNRYRNSRIMGICR